MVCRSHITFYHIRPARLETAIAPAVAPAIAMSIEPTDGIALEIRIASAIERPAVSRFQFGS